MSPSLPTLGLSVAAGAFGLCLAVLPARADTLAEAIALAYDSNPTLVAQRAQLQATDEGVAQAEAGFRPTASVQAAAGYSKAPQTSLFGTAETESNTGSATLSINQPLYTGGRTTAQVRAAKADVQAGREQLRTVEANVLFNVIQAYCDVLRDRADLAIQRESLAALDDAVNEIRARHNAGAATVVDVTQAEAQLETGRALVTSAQAQLEASTAAYVAAVGQNPGDLAATPVLPGLPTSLGGAIDIADQESPAVRQAQFSEAASRAQVQQARAARRPTLSLAGTLGYDGAVAPFIGRNYDRAVSATATLSQPLFTGGVIASQVRQAIAQDTSARVQVDVARRGVVQAIAQAWSQRAAAHANAVSQAAAVKAAQATFDGIRVEYRVGLRATLDVLIAQETLRDAKIALAAAEHDESVAEASLLGAVGRLEARVLVQGVPHYDTGVSYRRATRAGDVPWSIIPEALDKLGAPGLPEPGPLPELRTSKELVRMASSTATSDSGARP
jgi:outer membrane protein